MNPDVTAQPEKTKASTTKASAKTCAVCLEPITDGRRRKAGLCSEGCAMALRRQLAREYQREQSGRAAGLRARREKSLAPRPTPGWYSVTLGVEVTAADIAAGVPRHNGLSPVALAMRRAAEVAMAERGVRLGDLLVSATDSGVWAEDGLLPMCYKLPASARRLLREFNQGKRVRALAFEVPDFQIPERRVPRVEA